VLPDGAEGTGAGFRRPIHHMLTSARIPSYRDPGMPRSKYRPGSEYGPDMTDNSVMVDTMICVSSGPSYTL
jgi:hypothetical protein